MTVDTVTSDALTKLHNQINTQMPATVAVVSFTIRQTPLYGKLDRPDNKTVNVWPPIAEIRAAAEGKTFDELMQMRVKSIRVAVGGGNGIYNMELTLANGTVSSELGQRALDRTKELKQGS